MHVFDIDQQQCEYYYYYAVLLMRTGVRTQSDQFVLSTEYKFRYAWSWWQSNQPAYPIYHSYMLDSRNGHFNYTLLRWCWWCTNTVSKRDLLRRGNVESNGVTSGQIGGRKKNQFLSLTSRSKLKSDSQRVRFIVSALLDPIKVFIALVAARCADDSKIIACSSVFNCLSSFNFSRLSQT